MGDAASATVGGRCPAFREGQAGPGSRHRRPEPDGGRRLLLSLVLAAAIPVLLFGGLVAYVAAQQERAAARREASETVRQVAERVAAEMGTQVQAAEILAASSALDGPDLRAFHAEARRITDARPLWHTVQLADLSGAQVLNLLGPPEAPLGPGADRESFQRVVRTGRPAIGGVTPDGGVPGERLVALRVPVRRGGELRHVLSVALAPDAVGAILQGAGAPEGWVGAVVDAQGDVIARTAAGEASRGSPASPAVREAIARAPEGTYTGLTLERVEVETVYRALPGTGGWSVHLGIPSEALNAPVRRSTYLLAGGGAASLALGAGLAALVARDIARRRRDEAARSASALRASEERGALAVEAAELGTWRWDVGRGEVVGSERCRALLGLPRSRADAADAADAVWSAREVLGAVRPEDRLALARALRRCLRGGSPVDTEFRALQPGGGARWLRATGRAQQPLGPRRMRLVHGVVADVEPAKRAESERLGLLRRLAQAQEDERRRIARELHDQVGQPVTGLSLGLKGLEGALARAGIGEDARGRVRWLQELAAGVGRDIHRVASDLRPAALDSLGLHRALADYAADWGERYGLSVDVQAVGDLGRLPADVGTAVYRVVQEALTNALKHAAARNVSIVLELKAGQLRVVVEDDGRGFDPKILQSAATPDGGRDRARRGLGLSGIRERLAQVGGSFALESAPGAGTSLFVRVPIAPPDGPGGEP